MEDNVYEAFETMTIEEAPSMKKVRPERCSTVRVLVFLSTLSILLILAHLVLVTVIHYRPYAEIHTSGSLHSMTNGHLGPAEICTCPSTDLTTVSITDDNLGQTTAAPDAEICTCPSTSYPSTTCPNTTCPSTTCPTCPSKTCPICPSTTCPRTTCPTCPSTTCPTCPIKTCPTCPTTTCPSTTCPTCPRTTCPSTTCPSTTTKSVLVCRNNGQISSDGECICPARYSGKHCERELTNLARMSGVTCSATSVYSSDYSCYKGIDNDSGTKWVANLQVNPVFLTINFPRSVVITSVKLLPRCALYTQTTAIDYSMSLSSYKITRACGGTNTVHDCTNVFHDPEVFFKDDVHTRTTYLEVKIHGYFCQKTTYSYLGFREIEIWGYY